jgi:hypothetical protein
MKSISQNVFLLYDNARPHTATVTTGTLKEMHWEVLPHPAYSRDLVPRDFHVFGTLKRALGGKGYRADDEVKFSVQRWVEVQPKLVESGTL